MKIAVAGAWHVHTAEYAEAIIKNPKAELCCLWDSDKSRGKQASEKLGVPFAPDISYVLNDPEIDGICVTSATSEHTELLTAAAKAGKHIFTEKVLTITDSDAGKVAEAVKKSGIKFTICLPHKSRPELIAAKNLTDSGRLGGITYARVHDYHNGSVAPMPDGSSGWLPQHFYNAEATGGGAMIDLGAHPMYTLRWLLGKPVSIVSQFTEITGRGVEDNAVSVIEFENGAIGVSETGFVTSGLGYIAEVHGTLGALMIHNGILEYSCSETGGALTVKKDLPAAAPSPIDGWIDACCGGGEAPCGIDEAVMLTRLMTGAYTSYRTGKKYFF